MRISRKQHEYNLKKYIELCNKGVTYKEMEKIIGVRNKTIRTYRIKTGVEKKNLKADIVYRIKEMYLNGISSEDIAICLGMSLRTVYAYRTMFKHLDKSEVPSKDRLLDKGYVKNLLNNIDKISNNSDKKFQ